VQRVSALDGLWRVRLSSLEPGDLTDRLLAVCRDNPTVAPHFHLPLQSGSDRVLKRMNRQYSSDDFRRTVDRLRVALDAPAISTDVIVGFPGEGEDEFAATLSVAKFSEFCKIHTFPFSAIQPTAAWHWRSEAPSGEVVRARVSELASLERTLAEDYRRRFVGLTVEGLVERGRNKATGMRTAMSERGLKIEFEQNGCDRGLTGQIVGLTIDRITSRGVHARLADTEGGANR